ncbi:MAG: hypothetical protein AAFR87_34870 [Bacteroidota bacterium]
MPRQRPSTEVSVKQKVSPWLVSLPFAVALAAVLFVEILHTEDSPISIQKTPAPAISWLADNELEEADIITYLRDEIHRLVEIAERTSEEEDQLANLANSLILYEAIEDHRTRLKFFQDDASLPRDSLENEIILLYQELTDKDLLIDL